MDIDEQFRSCDETVLYHYTSIKGLMGIVKSGELWASNVWYLNDSSEVSRALEHLAITAESHGSSLRDEGERRFLGVSIRKWIEHLIAARPPVFVFALSSKGNLLSQWRGYTPHGKGVSICFPVGTLKHIADQPGFSLVKCRYNTAEHGGVLHAVVARLLGAYRNARPMMDEGRRDPQDAHESLVLQPHTEYVIRMMTIIKHPAFEEEQEWRIVSPHYFPPKAGALIQFREGSSMLLPYIVLPLPPKPAGQPVRHFLDIMLGPSRDVELSWAALRLFMQTNNHKVRIHSCGIPYRQWN